MTLVARTALCPGTYDPPTLGHLDIVRRAARQFDRVIVGVASDPTGKHPLFTPDERVAMLRDALADLDAVEVRVFTSLAVAFARECGATALVKGLRTIADLEHETSMARLNADMDSSIDTLFLLSDPRFDHVSSSGIRELATYGADVSAYVTPLVARRLRERAAAGR